MQALSKYYKKNYHDFSRFFLKLFMEYSKNKTVQKVVPKGWVWFMLSLLLLISLSMYKFLSIFYSKMEMKLWIILDYF
jgi:hypothetical protein